MRLHEEHLFYRPLLQYLAHLLYLQQDQQDLYPQRRKYSNNRPLHKQAVPSNPLVYLSPFRH
jgi:hypothetical protein